MTINIDMMPTIYAIFKELNNIFRLNLFRGSVKVLI